MTGPRRRPGSGNVLDVETIDPRPSNDHGSAGACESIFTGGGSVLRRRAAAGWPWLAAGLSGLLLAAAFPPLEIHGLAWWALVPLLVAVRFLPPRRAALAGLLAGVLQWFPSLFWLTRVTWTGWVVLGLYCALYTLPLAWGAALWLRRAPPVSAMANLGFMAVCTLVWAGSEYVRGVFGTGFPWNGLGVSQHANLPVAQAAAWGGVPAVSALLVWMNAALAATLLRYHASRGRPRLRWHPEMMTGLLAMALVFSAGWRKLQQAGEPGTLVRVAVIQPNIPQVKKWSPAHVDLIYRRLEELTSAALRMPAVDLAVWPETALPDQVRHSERSYQLVSELSSRGVPLLVGSIDASWPETDRPNFYNSSLLFAHDGELLAAYDKQHLVMFGEYTPLANRLPFLRRLAVIPECFTAGTEAGIMELPSRKTRFAPLICFEDAFSYLARRAVREGARLLVNQTNDAWFDPSSGSRQHLLQGVFRSIETGVPTVRAANTGYSCRIDPQGRILDVLTDEQGNQQLAGFRLMDVPVPADDQWQPTFFVRHGEWFGKSNAVAAVLLLAWLRLKKRRMKQNPAHSSAEPLA